MANSVDPDQTAPIGAVCSGSMLFATILNSAVMLGNYLQQTTSADDIFRCIFFLGTLRVKCIEMTPKYSPILWWPPKISTKSSYPKNYLFFWKPPKILKFRILNPPKNDLSLRMYENIRVSPAPLGGRGDGKKKQKRKTLKMTSWLVSLRAFFLFFSFSLKEIRALRG